MRHRGIGHAFCQRRPSPFGQIERGAADLSPCWMCVGDVELETAARGQQLLPEHGNIPHSQPLGTWELPQDFALGRK